MKVGVENYRRFNGMKIPSMKARTKVLASFEAGMNSPNLPWHVNITSLRLRLHGTGPEPFRTEPDRIGFCLHGTVWNRSRCLHGTFLEPVRIGSDTGPAKQQVQFWIRSGPVPERSRVNRRPIRSENRTGSVPDRSRVNIA